MATERLDYCNMSSSRLFAGIMSGTSADGVDVAIVRIDGKNLDMSARLLHSYQHPYRDALRRAIWEIRDSGVANLATLALLAHDISTSYAIAFNKLLESVNLSPGNLCAIAAHGQTLFHHPPETIQWLDPALLAAETGCVVISDFRRADCAAGGQGAPLVPLADYLLFRDTRKNRVLLNLGGIANLTFLRASADIDELIAFDAGPANCLSDDLVHRHDRTSAAFDDGGRRAAQGKVSESLVEGVLSDPYFSKPPPKSTDGPEMIRIFSEAQSKIHPPLHFADLLASACKISAETIARSIREYCKPAPDEIIASGGGTKNRTLMAAIHQAVGKIPLRNIDELGIDSSAKEAMAFALLGAATLDGYPGNVPSATGARRAVILGSITPIP
jgi:anhydro-N-acetylmuramic acid kinase